MTTQTDTLERSALIVTTVTSFMGPFMISSVNVALPAIQQEFSADAVLLSWIATAYLLATAVFLVPMGRLADIYGRRRVFNGGLVAFTVTTFLSAFAGSLHQLILLRVLQGAGAAMMVSTGMAILTSVFPPRKRGRAIGIYVSAVYIGLSLGPFVGGFMTQQLGWRSLFFLVTPVGLFSIWISLVFLKGEWADARGEAFDYWGSVLYAVSLLLIIYGATRLPELFAVGLILIGMLALAAFIRQELRIQAPVFDVRLFVDNKLFAFSSFAALINYAATFAVTFLLSLYLQYIKGLSPQSAGTLLVVQPVCMALFSPFAGKLSDRIEPRRIASAGMALTTLGLIQLALLTMASSRIYVVAALLTLGIGFALFSSPNMNAIMGAVAKRHYGSASGTVSTMRLLGQMMSMAVATIVFALLLGDQQIVPQTFPAFMESVKICFSAFATICFVGIFFSLFRGDLRQDAKTGRPTG